MDNIFYVGNNKTKEGEKDMESVIVLRKKDKNSKGITLIALVITIIVLLILVGVTIGILMGNNGILDKAERAAEENTKQVATEIINLKITNAQIQSYSEKQELPTLQYLADILCEDIDMDYVLKESQKQAKLNDKIDVSNVEFIYTKLEEYPYEFKIDGKLRLAAIDGIEITDNNSNKEDFVSKEEYNALLERVGELEKKLDGNSNIQNPTGIKTEVYIRNEIAVTTSFEKATSMSGLTRNTDANNKIAEYVSYDNTTGYTVLKSGWYFINLTAMAYGDSTRRPAASLNFVVDGETVTYVGHSGLQGIHDSDTNSFSIFLKQGQKFYFDASGIGEALTRYQSALCYPMF